MLVAEARQGAVVFFSLKKESLKPCLASTSDISLNRTLVLF
jgi:hypothetical protein